MDTKTEQTVELYCRWCLWTIHPGDRVEVVEVNGKVALIHSGTGCRHIASSKDGGKA